MSHFIVIFTRNGASRQPPEVERIEEADAAMKRLFALEEALRGDPHRGVVMLVADDEETIRATHSQYFNSIEEILDVPA